MYSLKMLRLGSGKAGNGMAEKHLYYVGVDPGKKGGIAILYPDL